MLGCDNIVSICLYAVKIIELLKQEKNDKESVSARSNYTYISSHWFISKPRERSEYNGKNCRKVIMCIFRMIVLLQQNINKAKLS